MEVANVDTVYKGVLDIVNKNQVDGYLDSIEFNRYADLAQREWFNESYFMYGSTQNAQDNMAILKSNTTVSVNSNGLLTLPTDYMHLIAIGAIVYISQTEFKLVDVVGVSDSQYRMNAMTKAFAPTRDFPSYVLNADTVQIYPKTLTSNAQVDYLRQPISPVWGFTVVNDEKVYHSASSTQFEVPIQHTEDLIQSIVKRFGFETRDEAMVAYNADTTKPKQ